VNRVALLEDHERMAELIDKGLRLAGITVDVYDTIARARQSLLNLPYAVLIIDRGLPDGDGLTLLRWLRRQGSVTPCLMLTALDALHDRIDGLEAGADDYLPKPFSMEELTARVRALMRRVPTLQTLTPAFGGITIDPVAGCMRHGAEHVSLAPAEMQIMLSLTQAGGQPVRRMALELAAWGTMEAVTPNAMDVALHRLRKKLRAIGSEVQIDNIRGYGYALATKN